MCVGKEWKKIGPPLSFRRFDSSSKYHEVVGSPSVFVTGGQVRWDWVR